MTLGQGAIRRDQPNEYKGLPLLIANLAKSKIIGRPIVTVRPVESGGCPYSPFPGAAMTDLAPGQMTWKPTGSTDPALHLRHHPHEPWQPYAAFPEYVLPDPPGFSIGYATFIALLKKNWQTIK
jgi:hypothetical protein